MLRFIGMSESLACGCPSWNGRPRTRARTPLSQPDHPFREGATAIDASLGYTHIRWTLSANGAVTRQKCLTPHLRLALVRSCFLIRTCTSSTRAAIIGSTKRWAHTLSLAAANRADVSVCGRLMLIRSLSLVASTNGPRKYTASNRGGRLASGKALFPA